MVCVVRVDAAEYSRRGFGSASPHVNLVDQLLVAIVPGK